MTKLSTKQDLAPMEIAEEVMKLEKLKKQVDERLKQHKADLLKVMTDLDVVSLKTGSYTLSRKTYNRMRVADDQATIKDLEARNVPVETKEVLDMDLMKNPIKQLVDAGEELAGVVVTETPYVTVRLAKEKK